MNAQTETAITLQPIGPAHVDGAHRLSRLAGWPHRPDDWRLSLALSEGRVALAEGEVVGAALMTPFGTDATINMVIVDEALRGRGIGRRLMDAAIELAGSRALRLVATAEGLPLYEKLGFRAVGEIVQHQGLAAPVAAPDTVALAEAGELGDIAALDREAFGADRSALLAHLGERGRFAVLRREGRVDGYACLRDFGRGEVIGPVIARDGADARDLIAFFLAGRAGRFVRIDAPAETRLGPWLTGLGLVHVGGGVAMRRPALSQSAAPLARPSHICFALASQAFG